MSYYLVIHTQDLENYGAHDWDGEGACPQYWKYKGGTSLAMPIKSTELTSRDANYAARALEALEEHKMLQVNNYFKTFYKDHQIVESCDLYIALDPDDQGPSGTGYSYFGYVFLPHLDQSRFCWLKDTTPPPSW